MRYLVLSTYRPRILLVALGCASLVCALSERATAQQAPATAADWAQATPAAINAGTAMVAHPGGINDEQAKQVAAYVWAVSHGKAKP